MESMSSRAYQQIRRRIIRLELAPGRRDRRTRPAGRARVGRTPVREALQRLARDQFVTVMPRRGMLVSSIDVSELSMLYETRAVMEPYAARLACGRGTTEHWAAMSDTIDEAPSASADEDTARHRSSVPRDHLAGREQPLSRRQPGHALRPQRPRVAHVSRRGGRHRHAVVEHAEILDALAARDADGRPRSSRHTSARSTNRFAAPSPHGSAHRCRPERH